LTPLPRELQIEVTGSCNLRCKMCLVSYRPALGRREGSLSLQTFGMLLDANPQLERVTVQGLGEPLLAPGLFEMVDLAAGRGIQVGFNTNGMLLTADRADRLVRVGLAWLHISLDGARAETYEAIRGGGDFSQVVRNIKALVAVKRKLRTTSPRLQLNFVAMRRNVEELPELVGLVADWGLERLWVQNLSHTFDDTDSSGTYRGIRRFAAQEALWSADDRELVSRIFDVARAEADRLEVPLRLPRLEEPARTSRPAGQPGCDWPWTSAYVAHDGKVQPCCMVMGSDRATLGNLSTNSFLEIWNGEQYQAFRQALKTDKPPTVCRGCSAYRGVF
jgi:radical SAM protein with 4Fe4S-binding SPASM domain